VTSLFRYRRHRLALPALLLAGLIVAGTGYAAVLPSAGATDRGPNEFTAEQIEDGRELFLANCATCHGLDAEGGTTDGDGKVSGPSLIGVGAASVDFQVGTGRMPLQASGPQAPERAPQFSLEETRALAAYVASLAPGPGIPEDRWLDPEQGDVAEGGEIFRTNCAMCHNFFGNGGALTEGKYAPAIDSEPVHTYEAMVTGPQNMPVFSDDVLTPEQKRDVIAFLEYAQAEPAPGGLSLGAIGPVSEGLIAWIVGIGGLVALAVWLGARAS
jgi:ubiquinol-cytochrome c reductase cytochrome c subunit